MAEVLGSCFPLQCASFLKLWKIFCFAYLFIYLSMRLCRLVFEQFLISELHHNFVRSYKIHCLHVLFSDSVLFVRDISSCNLQRGSRAAISFQVKCVLNCILRLAGCRSLFCGNPFTFNSRHCNLHFSSASFFPPVHL